MTFRPEQDGEARSRPQRDLWVRPKNSDLKDVLQAYFGERVIHLPRFHYTSEAIALSGIDNGVILGSGIDSLITLKAGENTDILRFTDCNDFILDKFALNGGKAGQTGGSGIGLIRVRRSAIGPSFLRIDDCKEHGINDQGTGAYPNSNVCNVFGNIFIYTCDKFGYEGGGYSGDEIIMRAYIQECILGAIDELGTHLQVVNAHLHECNYGIRNATHDCDHGILNIEGSDYDGIRIDGGGGSQGMKNSFDITYLFDNNQSAGSNYSDIRCVGATAKWNAFNIVRAYGFNHVKYNFSDHAVSGSGNKNRVHLLQSQDWVTAQALLCTDGGTESIIDLLQTTT